MRIICILNARTVGVPNHFFFLFVGNYLANVANSWMSNEKLCVGELNWGTAFVDKPSFFDTFCACHAWISWVWLACLILSILSKAVIFEKKRICVILGRWHSFCEQKTIIWVLIVSHWRIYNKKFPSKNEPKSWKIHWSWMRPSQFRSFTIRKKCPFKWRFFAQKNTFSSKLRSNNVETEWLHRRNHSKNGNAILTRMAHQS